MREKRGQPKLAIDIDALERDLKADVDGEVRFDTASRALYVSDASNYRQVPIGVVIPRSVDAVVHAVAACRRHGAPIVSRGAGTALAGQTCNVAVVIDFSKYLNRILDIDPEKKLARVQPGVILDHLRDTATEQHGLIFGPDPATHAYCTLGGMIGNNSCGIHSVMAGRTADNVHELEVLTYDGIRMRVGRTDNEEFDRIVREGGRRADIYLRLRSLMDRCGGSVRKRYPKIPRLVSGYSLDQLLPENGFNVARALVGSESSCVTVLEAVVRLVPAPRRRSLLVLGYPDIYAAGDHIPEVMEHGPIGCEGIDDRLVSFMDKKGLHLDYVKLLPGGDGWLFVEFGGDTKDEAEGKARRLMDELKKEKHPPSMKLFIDPKDEEHVWKVRESGLGATANVPGMPLAWPGWEDAAVPPERLGNYLRDFRNLLNEFGYEAALYGHFGQGCIHCRITFDLFTRKGIDEYLAFVDRASDLIVRYGGSFSGEHGDGQSRAVFLPKLFGRELMEAFREFKSIWDPEWKMNPGKVIDAYSPDQNLRLGAGYRPEQPATDYAFPRDKGGFPDATLRCVGVGQCRKPGNTFMCPSFVATREELHTTRGRAHLLFEMFRGDLIRDGWKSREVHESLELCLACKGCKDQCPVNVDLATYKSEFLSHYYHHRLRPRSHYAMGLIGYWGPWASKVPWLANFFTQAPGMRGFTKFSGGYDQRRWIPKFASTTFTQKFRKRKKEGAGSAGEHVLLVPDLYNDMFFPETLDAAAAMLGRWGFKVVLPDPAPREVRPLIHEGMLGLSKRELRKAMATLSEHAASGTPLLFIEPSTVSVYRDELTSLFPHDRDAVRIKEASCLLSEFIEERGLDLPKLEGKAIFHGHCHEKAVLNADAARKVLLRMGLEFEEPEPGCCGMAGSFGLEKNHYDVSLAIGEANLLPAVRRATRSTYIIADGFSCRSQIIERTGRKPLHLAELLDHAWLAAGGFETKQQEEKDHDLRKAA